ncbi:ATP-binding protein [Poseidonocella sp. HB161398]|uniref:PAS domain-containing sensor histidine kinase n=1 Tax=Poseidonocella sp. HB161398 TaxID=2320855 RepID=UPI00110903E8|nr:ATP-binding protein [Poseidonocella sp. HB161398]
MTGGLGGFLDLIPESVLLRRTDGLILEWNAAAETLYGLPRARAIGRFAADLFGTGAGPEEALAALESTGAWEGALPRPGADGRDRIVHVRWRRGEGPEAAIVETGRDITAERAAAEALRKSEHRYRNLFQAMAASFWELDFFPVGEMLYRLRKSGAVADWPGHFAANPALVREMMRATRVIDVNEQTVATFGRAGGGKEELLRSVEPFWPEASSGVFAASVAAAVGGAPNFSAETRLRTIDGREFPALFTACFPADTMNKGTLLVGVIDLSELVAAQQALARMQDEMAHAARVSMLGELAASIAHEINQPLGAIAAHAAAGQRWLDRDPPELDEVRALMASVGADACRAADIVGRVRAMASGHAPEPGPVPVNAVIADAVTFLNHEIRRSGTRVETRLCRSDPVVLADRVQLQQVVVNLAMNALQAMADTPAPLLSLETGTRGGRVLLGIADTGPGVAAEVLPRLFDSFFTTRATGMGMGLAIARGIAGRFGGEIRAGNRPGGGALFEVDLPVCPGGILAHTKV